MRSVKVGVVLLAATAFSVVTTTSASATGVFLSSIENAALLSEKIATQTFATNEGSVECQKAKVKGDALSAENAQAVEVDYESCTAFGFVGVSISVAHYDFKAGGSLEIESPITIEVPLTGCVVTVPAQTVSSVAYATEGNNIKLTPNATSIHYEANGACVEEGSFGNGTYKGSSEWMIAGGTLGFMPNGGQEQITESSGELAGINNPFELEATILSIKAVGNGGTILGGTCKVFKNYAALTQCTVEQDPPVKFVVKWMAY